MARGVDSSSDPRRRDWSAWQTLSGSGGVDVSSSTADRNYPHRSQVSPAGTGHIVHTNRVLPGASQEQMYTIGPFASRRRGQMAADAFHARAESRGEDHESVERYREGSAFRTLPPTPEHRLR